jgi:hypothetical protein
MHGPEHGLWWQGTAPEASGLVQFHFGSSPFEAMGVVWDSAASYQDAEGFLDQFSVALEGIGLGIEDSWPLEPAIEDSHEAVYWQFDITENGVDYTGISRA